MQFKDLQAVKKKEEREKGKETERAEERRDRGTPNGRLQWCRAAATGQGFSDFLGGGRRNCAVQSARGANGRGGEEGLEGGGGRVLCLV